jgi:hypothetical protein
MENKMRQRLCRVKIVLELMLEQTLQEFENKLGFRPGEKSGFLSISTLPCCTLKQRTKVHCGDITLGLQIEASIKTNQYYFVIDITESDHKDFRYLATASTCQPDRIIVEQMQDACMAGYIKYLNDRKGE